MDCDQDAVDCSRTPEEAVGQVFPRLPQGEGGEVGGERRTDTSSSPGLPGVGRRGPGLPRLAHRVHERSESIHSPAGYKRSEDSQSHDCQYIRGHGSV